ncbi:MAG: hypothetical protein JOZ75_04530 [Candidatus Dormibacteraeota bacterium]|nr:hypothetical protein [Candidatus Dormibacteraeota bacterium]
MTKVPPSNELSLEHVPPGPPVDNRTNGAVSNADAQAWVNAGNRESGWFEWAEASGQLPFLAHISAESLLNPAERTALDAGATIDQPACNLYPAAAALFPIGADGLAYFGSGTLNVNDKYVIVAQFPSPCSPGVAKYPDGHLATLNEPFVSSTAFIPGQIVHDLVLGDIWYSDGGGNCNDPKGPPPEWCAR